MAFTSNADNLVSGDGNGTPDVFVRDLSGTTPTTERVSVASDEQPPTCAGDFGSGSRGPAITGDGRFVAFSSDAVNFTDPAQTLNRFDVFVRDREAGTTELASPDAGGGEADGANEGAAISPDGRFASFASFASDLVAESGGDPQLQDAYVRDRTAGSAERVSVASDHSNAKFGPFDTHVATGPVSADGRVSLITTNADNLFPGDDNNDDDVFFNDHRPAADLALEKRTPPIPSCRAARSATR